MSPVKHVIIAISPGKNSTGLKYLVLQRFVVCLHVIGISLHITAIVIPHQQCIIMREVVCTPDVFDCIPLSIVIAHVSILRLLFALIL